MTDLIDINRRKFVQLGLAAIACSVANPVLAAMPRVKGVRTLAFYNLHTDERLRVNYWKDGVYSRPALARINQILRDYRSGDVHEIHPRLIDLIYDLQNKVNNHNVIEIISGYRSPRTNARMASYSGGIARQSYHIKGMAIDLRISGTSLSKLHKTALGMRRGGVGYYPSSEFVHVDVGPVRRW